MSWWTKFRDGLETTAAIVANYFYPGVGILGAMFNSQGSREQLGSTLGQMALLGGGMAGAAGVGNAGVSTMNNYGTTMNAASEGLFGPSAAGGAGGAAGGISGVGTAGVNGELVQQFLDQGYTQEQALQMAQQSSVSQGVSGAASGTAGGQLQQQGFPSGGTLGGGISGTGTIGGGGVSTGLSPPTAGAAGAMPWGSPSNLMTMGTGAYGLLQANQMQQAAQRAQQQADPFGPYRQQYAQQMAALSADPSKLQQMPGYQAGLQAVQRSMAAQGYTGSGNMMAALSKYGGDFYNQTMNMYGGFAGAGVNPGTGAQLGLQGQALGTNLAINSLGLMGRGAGLAGG